MQRTVASVLARIGDDAQVVWPEASLKRVVRMMNEHRVGAIVVQDGDEPVGIVTERDVLVWTLEHGLDPRTTTVGRLMSKGNVPTASPNTPIDIAAENVARRGSRHLLVMEKGRLLGLVQLEDLVLEMVDETRGAQEREVKSSGIFFAPDIDEGRAPWGLSRVG